MFWDEMTEEEKKEWYKSYVYEVIYEYGDNFRYQTFEEFDENSKGEYFGL